jgi:hypothetical protein
VEAAAQMKEKQSTKRDNFRANKAQGSTNKAYLSGY